MGGRNRRDGNARLHACRPWTGHEGVFSARRLVHSAAIQDRDGAALVFDRIRQRFNWLELVWADGGDNARQVEHAVAAQPPLRVEIVKRPDGSSGFKDFFETSAEVLDA